MAVPKIQTGPPIPLVIDYQDPDGNWWSLSDTSMSQGWVCSAIAGIEGLAIAMQTIPLLDGTALPLTYLPATGTIGLAILVGRPESTNDEFAYYNNLDKVVRAFYNSRNAQAVPGTLRVTRPDGSQRVIATYCTSGLNTPEVGLNDMTLFSLALSTPDPYWSDYGPGTALHFPVVFGNTGLLPINFSANSFPPADPNHPGIFFNPTQESGNFILTNWGDAPCYPNWVFTGPGQPTVTNTKSGRKFSLSQSIPAGQQVQITTKPGASSCYNITTGINWWSSLVLTSTQDLFPIMSGDNPVTISVVGATPATTVDVNFTNRWLRA